MTRFRLRTARCSFLLESPALQSNVADGYRILEYLCNNEDQEVELPTSMVSRASLAAAQHRLAQLSLIARTRLRSPADRVSLSGLVKMIRCTDNAVAFSTDRLEHR